MNSLLRYVLVLAALLHIVPGCGAQTLQAMVDSTPPGGTLSLAPGVYVGPVLIDRAITLDGGGKVTVDGGGKGTVVKLRTRGATIRGLHITHSGDSHDDMDAAIVVEGDANVVEGNVLDDVLFGIVLKAAKDNRVRANYIRSRHADPADRGDALRLWYSFGNRIEHNSIDYARDIALANSAGNRIIGNTVRNSRTGLHMIFAKRTLIEGNTFSHNSGGIFAINSDGITLRGNRIEHATSASGVGIGLKETSSALIQGNEIVHCGVGILADSPLDPVSRISIVDNTISSATTGIVFYGEMGGHIITGNRFRNNLSQVTMSLAGDPLQNTWRGNYWDDYEGFDLDNDGVGDRPYEILTYSDRIWIEEPKAQFFRNSPVLELIDFLEQLAPFVSPNLILRDPVPRVPVGHKR